MNQFLAWIMTANGALSFGLLLIFAFLFFVFLRAQLKGQLDWRDLIVRTNTNKVSLTKILQMVGGIVATWVIIKTTVSPEGLSWELFTAYLAYVGSVEAYSKYVANRYEGPNSSSNSSMYGGYNSGYSSRQNQYHSKYNQDYDDDDTGTVNNRNQKDARIGAAKAP